uniref:Epidermal growth factor receptor pathway substrate 15 n=1 Tax=Ornithorhynchus anatinus TaxID=9258 RepID=A0A6I8NLB6_ORNAN
MLPGKVGAEGGRHCPETWDLQDEVKRESTNLQKLQTQKQEAEELLNELEEQKAKLEEQLHDIRQKCAEEAQLVSTLQAELASQESQICAYEEELGKARAELSQLQQEALDLAESVEAGRAQLGPLRDHLQESQQEISSMQMKLSEMREVAPAGSQGPWGGSPHSMLVNGSADYCSLSNSSSDTANLNEHGEGPSPREAEPGPPASPVRSSPEMADMTGTDDKEELTIIESEKEDPFTAESHPLSDPVAEASLDFFQTDPFVGSDPFKDDPFGKIDPFGGDPFRGSDPFAADSFFKQSTADDPFAATSPDPFSAASSSSDSAVETLKSDDPFAPGGTAGAAASDPDPFASLFGNESFEEGFADFSTMSKANNEDPFGSAAPGSGSNVVLTKNVFEEPPGKNQDVPPALPPKTGTPTRPCPPPPGKRPTNRLDSSDSLKLNDPFQPFSGSEGLREKAPHLTDDPFAPTVTAGLEVDSSNFANFPAYSTEEDMIEWAKRESEREEKERLARLNQQELEDLELAIALSKSEISEA